MQAHDGRFVVADEVTSSTMLLPADQAGSKKIFTFVRGSGTQDVYLRFGNVLLFAHSASEPDSEDDRLERAKFRLCAFSLV